MGLPTSWSSGECSGVLGEGYPMRGDKNDQLYSVPSAESWIGMVRRPR